MIDNGKQVSRRAEGEVIIKDQYFGDNRDLFKYDLVMQVMQAGLVRCFTYIPMLTGPDAGGQGGRTDRRKAGAGFKNTGLVAFLDSCLDDGQRDIQELAGFFDKSGVANNLYGRGFTHRQRREYFTGIEDGWLTGALVLVDPDNGLEVKRSGEGHVLYSEVKDLYRRMGGSSILMLYQHFPRQPHQQYLNGRCTEIKEKVTGDWPVCIDDGDVAFFFLTQDEQLEHRLTHVIADYAEAYTSGD